MNQELYEMLRDDLERVGLDEDKRSTGLRKVAIGAGVGLAALGAVALKQHFSKKSYPYSDKSIAKQSTETDVTTNLKNSEPAYLPHDPNSHIFNDPNDVVDEVSPTEVKPEPEEVKVGMPEELKPIAAKVNWNSKVDLNKIIYIESRNVPNRKSSADAYGLMQIKKGAWGDVIKRLGISKDDENWFWETAALDPYKNMIVGTYYINNEIPRLLKGDGFPDTTTNRVGAYHAGIGNLRNYKKRSPNDWEKAAGYWTKDYIKTYNRIKYGKPEGLRNYIKDDYGIDYEYND